MKNNHISHACTRRLVLSLGLIVPVGAWAQSSRPTFTRQMNTKEDWQAFLVFLKDNKALNFDLDLTVPEKPADVAPQMIDGRYVGFLMTEYNIVLIATNGAVMKAGQPTRIRGVFKLGSGGEWYGYKKLFLTHVRDL